MQQDGEGSMQKTAAGADLADAQLRQNLRWLEDAMENIPSAVYIKGTDGRYRYVNHGWERVTGRTRSEAVGHNDVELFGAEIGSLLHSNDQQVIASGVVRQFEEAAGSKAFLAIKTPLFEGNEVIGLCGISTDISERKTMEEQIRSSAARFRNLFEASADAVMLLDTDKFLDCNGATLKIFGCKDRTEFLGKHPSELSPPNQADGTSSRDLADQRIKTAFEDGRNFFEWTHLRVDTGETFPAEVLLNTVEVNGALILQAVVRDVSQRKRAEEVLRHAKDLAEAATKMKSDFLANMSHELRTPLNAIIGFTGTLLMKLPGPLTNDQERQLNVVKNSAQHLLSLINDLLDLAKIEAGRMELRPEPVLCQRVIQEVASTLRPLAERKNLVVDLELPEMPVAVSVDPRALKQIVLNLVSNAIKFTDSGGVRLSLQQVFRRDGPHVEISVSDTGIGIRPEDRDRLFQAFSQVDSVSDGTGLGLHLSQRFAQLIGGHIEFESEYGKGSRFALVLPI
jgi:protein-histidine pros-kinase